MKKNLLSLLLPLCLCVIKNYAQEKGSLELGIGAGVNIVGITSGALSSDSRTAFNVSASGDYYFSDRWSLKGQVIYDQKGWKSGWLTVNGKPIVQSTNYKLNYITIPVMTNWHFGKKRNWYLNFGPYIGFLTNANNQSVDIKSGFNSLDVGLALGIGVKIPLSERCKLFLEYQGQGGMTNIEKDHIGSAGRNLRVAFNAGLTFPIK